LSNTVSIHLIEKWRQSISPKTWLCFKVRVRVRIRVSVRVRVRAGVSVNTFSIKRVFDRVRVRVRITVSVRVRVRVRERAGVSVNTFSIKCTLIRFSSYWCFLPMNLSKNFENMNNLNTLLSTIFKFCTIKNLFEYYFRTNRSIFVLYSDMPLIMIFHKIMLRAKMETFLLL